MKEDTEFVTRPAGKEPVAEGVLSVLFNHMSDFLDQMEHVQSLLAELRAIRVWDKGYQNNRHHEWWETPAMVSRFRRRAEILQELLTIIATMSYDFPRSPRMRKVEKTVKVLAALTKSSTQRKSQELAGNGR